MIHESVIINIDGTSVHCRSKITGDWFRYFVDHYEFPFCSLDKPQADGSVTARCYGGRLIEMADNINHETIARWALETIKQKDINYYNTLKG